MPTCMTTMLTMANSFIKTMKHPFLLCVLVTYINNSNCYTRKPCTRSVRYQFQLPDCYVPPMDTSILLSSASFLLSHNAATGYIKKGSLTKSGLTWWYSKNQIGTVYEQLNDGARALDLRPKLLANNTVIFRHGSINIPTTFDQVVSDAVNWCSDNDDELVIILSSRFAWESNDDDDSKANLVSAMSAIYERFGVPYYECGDVYGLSIAETMKLAALSSGGYLIALDGHEDNSPFCGHSNWVENELVTCYPKGNASEACTSSTSTEPLTALKSYMLASANNEATDDRSTLGPPVNLYNYPFNEIQALWQVDTASTTVGVSRLSSILNDNKKSNLNENLVGMIYENEFNAISLFGVDNVALNGNALLSVLRTSCGQSDLADCGQKIDKPKITYFHIKKVWSFMLIIIYISAVGSVIVLILKKEDPQPRLVFTTFARFSETMKRQVQPASAGLSLDENISRRTELLSE